MSDMPEVAAPSPRQVSEATIEKLCAELRARLPEAESDERICDFAARFYRKAPKQLLEERDADSLAALTHAAFRFLDEAGGDGASVQVRNPEEEGWRAPVTILRATIGDRPFIVDTIREFLSAENLPIQHYIYPVLAIERGPDGGVVRVGAPDGGRKEALVHCELQRIHEEARRDAIRSEVERRLSDVIAATDDFGDMLKSVDHTIEELERYARNLPERADDLLEIGSFLRWLTNENFVFLGYRAYDLDFEDDEAQLVLEEGSGLGILRDEDRSAYAAPVPVGELPDTLRHRVLAGPSLIVSKTNAESTVHRRARMDYIGVKKLDDRGRVIGEHRFLGLFTSKAYQENAEQIPILRRKLQQILRRSGAAPNSHDYKEIITIFNSLPKEEVFQASPAELEHQVQEVLEILFTDEVRAWVRPDPLGRGASVMVILPRGRFSGEVRQRIQQALTERFTGQVLNYHLSMSAGDQARLHFYLSAPAEAIERIEETDIEWEVRQILRSWDDRLAEQLAAEMDREEAQNLSRLYSAAFGEEYRAANPPAVAVHDVHQLERMRRDGRTVAVDLRAPVGDGETAGPGGVTILKLYLRDERLVLSDFMPILENAGLRVIEVAPFAVSAHGLPHFNLYSFVVEAPDGGPLPLDRAEELAAALLAARRGDTANDPLSALVLRAGLRWREIDILRTYSAFTFQADIVPSRLSITRALLGYPDVARMLVDYYKARFDPQLDGDREEIVASQRAQIQEALEGVTALTDDRALRRILSIMEGTTRTNYFRYGGPEPTRRCGGAPYISIKVHSAAVEELRRDRILYEIFVYSSRMEGTHLRGAPVSRGGIRWSDRPDDFRTEVLGLVQTQITKNAVIVPGGSKGGFITKRVHPDRDRMMEEAADQYRTLICGMLDLTDNVSGGDLVPPENVVMHDDPDPYLVVAADKGTAHLSDTANQIADDYGFWLGDAFASGGSQGYDHKKVGITAKGAWECVRRHFREMGKDIQTEPFTVAGIGDMSGDVFGNGMLLSRQIRLIAAFDHRHVFIDPDPDPETSYRERERIFALPRSTWEDYDPSLLSPGAMVVPRASKEVRITPEARKALGLEGGPDRLDGEALVRAVLTAPVELLWNGGIGTYVKHPAESHSDAGDTANDPVRVDATDLRCQVVGEGGNLGFTQRGRICFALAGGRINTDAIDNSAGVDMSDHEVNLKILLNAGIQAGRLEVEARNQLLEEMTGSVTELVLRNNISQSLAVSLDEGRSRRQLWDYAAMITALEREGVLDRGAESLPTTDTIQERLDEGRGLTRPALSVLLAHAKLQAGAALLASDLPDDPATGGYLTAYFPDAAIEAAGEGALAGHRLRREIVTTTLVNDLVDLMGAVFLFRMTRDTGRQMDEVVRAWLVASALAGASEVREAIGSLEGRFPTDVVYRWLFGLARVLEGTTSWALANVDPAAPTADVIEEHGQGLRRIREEFPGVVAGEDREIFLERMEELKRIGVDHPLAAELITLRFLPQLLEILRIAREASADAVATARVYYRISERFAAATLARTVREAAGENRWEKRHAQELSEEIGRAHRVLAAQVLSGRGGSEDIDRRLAELEDTRAREVAAYRELMEEIATMDHPPISAYAVAVRALLQVAGL
jgi:glutamate dehydrogenase